MKYLLLLLALSGFSLANTSINWASDINAINVNSKGTPFTSEYIFELGTFREGVDVSDVSTWAEHWVSLDRTRYQPDHTFFGKTTVFTENAAPFLSGEQAYIWGYNPSGPESEWILLTDSSWTWPTVRGLALPVQFLVANATDVIIGGINTNDIQMQTAAMPEASPAVSWEEWRALSFTAEELTDPSVSGFEADADGDGKSNALEYFTGASPSDQRSLPNTLISLEKGVNGNLVVKMNKSSSANLNYELQSSENLSNFTPVEDAEVQSLSLFTIQWDDIKSETKPREFYRVVLKEE